MASVDTRISGRFPLDDGEGSKGVFPEHPGQVAAGGLGATCGQRTMAGRQQRFGKAPVTSLQLPGDDQPVEAVVLHATAQGSGFPETMAFHQDQATAMALGLTKAAESRLGEHPAAEGHEFLGLPRSQRLDGGTPGQAVAKIQHSPLAGAHLGRRVGHLATGRPSPPKQLSVLCSRVVRRPRERRCRVNMAAGGAGGSTSPMGMRSTPWARR